MKYMGTEKIVCCKCNVELDIPIYVDGDNKKYGFKHCHQCGAALLNPEEKEILLSIRQGIAAKYDYTQEQVSAYWQGVEDAQSELDISVKKAILNHLDILCTCVANAYDASHGLLPCDVKFIEKQEEYIRNLLSDENKR